LVSLLVLSIEIRFLGVKTCCRWLLAWLLGLFCLLRFGSWESKLVAVGNLITCLVSLFILSIAIRFLGAKTCCRWLLAWFLCLFCLLRFGSSEPKLVAIVDIFAAVVHATLLLLAVVVVGVVVDKVVGGATTSSTRMVKIIAAFDFALVDKEPSKGVLQEQSDRTRRGTSTRQIQVLAIGLGSSALPMVVLFCHDALVLCSTKSSGVMVVQRLVASVGIATATAAAARCILAVAIGVATGRFEIPVLEQDRVSVVGFFFFLIFLFLILVVVLDIAAAGIATKDIVAEDNGSSSHRRCWYC